MDAAGNTFHLTRKSKGRPDAIDNLIPERLDFHPLSVTLPATVAHRNNWDHDRLAREWEARQSGLFRRNTTRVLAATVELSLASGFTPFLCGLHSKGEISQRYDRRVTHMGHMK